jgi:hypothetical protein
MAYAEVLWKPEPLMTIDYKELPAGIVTKSEQPEFCMALILMPVSYIIISMKLKR